MAFSSTQDVPQQLRVVLHEIAKKKIDFRLREMFKNYILKISPGSQRDRPPDVEWRGGRDALGCRVRSNSPLRTTR